MRALFLLLICCLFSASIAQAQSASIAQAQNTDSGSRVFPPDNCVPGIDNVIVWRGPGTSTRCVPLPTCIGDSARLQYDGANLLCVSDNSPPPCVGSECTAQLDTCPPQEVSWQEGVNFCGGIIGEGRNGEVITVVNRTSFNASGKAQYRCVAPGPCPPGSYCPAVRPYWELLDGATCRL